MITERPRPILSEQLPGEINQIQQSQPKHRLFSTARIKHLFQTAAQFVTGRPKRRRKRDDETRGLFRKLALKVIKPVVRSIFNQGDFGWSAPPDELDETQRLLQRQWYGHEAIHEYDYDQTHHHHDEANHLFPHL